MTIHSGGTWAVVLPIKQGTQAKTRLAPFAGDRRRELARAMALDTVAATVACPDVIEVIVVTSDDEARAALRQLTVTIVPDAPDAGLNAALRHGATIARSRRPDTPVAALSADIPALRHGELTTALSAALDHVTSFVADSAGTGTTLYCANAGVRFDPHYGIDSRYAHVAAGAVELTLDGIDSLRRDVDTEHDLRAALTLGVGPHTKTALTTLSFR